MDIKGKGAVVTGGGGGIGRGIALALAEAGTTLMIADIEADKAKAVAAEIVARGGRAGHFQCDVSDPAAIARLADAAWETLGDVAILVNNAGVTATSPGFDMADDDLRWQIDVNIVGVLNGMREFGRRFRAKGAPAWIVNTASHNSLGAPFQGVAGYAATKHAVLGLSEAFRTDYPDGPVGISILCPGMVATEIWNSGRNRPASLGGRFAGDPRNGELLAQHGIGAEEVGRMAVAGIRDEDFYIFTHARDMALIEKRYRESRDCMRRQWPDAIG